MSIKSDNWIIRQCTRPTHRMYNCDGLQDRLISPPYNEEEKALIANWCDENKREIFINKAYAKPLAYGDWVDWKPMIDKFHDRPVRYVDKVTNLPYQGVFIDGEPLDEDVRKVISFGTSSYGYDVSLTSDPDQIKVFTNVFEPEIDPKRMKETNFAAPYIRVDEDGAKYVLIPAHSYIQAPTAEYFNIPRDVLVIVLGKSTYARSALICNVTPIEPEFEGKLTLQITNLTNKHLRVYLDEGVAKLLFHSIDR